LSRLGLLARRAARSRALGLLTQPYSPSRWTEVLNPLWADEDRAVVTDLRHENPDVLTVTLRPAPGWPGHRAGQHTVLRVDVDGVRVNRAFTIATSAHRTDRVELTCKAYPDAVVVPHLRDHAEPGMVVGLDHPTGDVVLPDPRPEHLVCVVGGSGVTPAMAMLRTLRDEQHRGRISFVQFARTAADELFADELDGLAATALPGLSVTTILTRDTSGPHAGRRLDKALLDELAPGWPDATSLVCGPVPMLAAAEEIWTGDLAERLLVERFRPAPLVIPDDVSGTVRFSRSQVTTDNDGRTLLEQAEDAGLAPESGCRMGICHTCDIPKLAGITRDVRNGELDTGERDKIQPCVSVALGDVDLHL
jgi:ferredoxin-NADP reductase